MAVVADSHEPVIVGERGNDDEIAEPDGEEVVYAAAIRELVSSK